MEMISRRLTMTQKAEILEAYRAGENTNSLAEKYSCTTSTIHRAVKNLLSDEEYTLLKMKRSKIGNKKRKIIDNDHLKDNRECLNIEVVKEFENIELKERTSLALDDYGLREELGSENKYSQKEELNNDNIDNDFHLIEPLLSSIDFDQDKQKSDFEILNYESLPEIVYMIVDKKVELELEIISDLPEWSFLPENELERKAILLFANQRSAKRSCSKNQRVIKIPNTSVFQLSKSYLISKGITRLILEDSIIALDN